MRSLVDERGTTSAARLQSALSPQSAPSTRCPPSLLVSLVSHSPHFVSVASRRAFVSDFIALRFPAVGTRCEKLPRIFSSPLSNREQLTSKSCHSRLSPSILFSVSTRDRRRTDVRTRSVDNGWQCTTSFVKFVLPPTPSTRRSSIVAFQALVLNKFTIERIRSHP